MYTRTLITFLFSLLTAAGSAMSTVDSLLNVLDAEVAHSQEYIVRRQAHIDSLCAIRPMTPALRLLIAREYQHFQADSSRAWYLTLDNAPEPIRTDAYIGFVSLVASTGHYSNAIALLAKPTNRSISSVEGYKMAWLLFSDAAANAQVPIFQEEAKINAQLYYDSMMVALEAAKDSSEEYALWYASYRAQEKNDWEEAIRNNAALLNRVTPADHLYAILAYGQAMLYEQAGNKEKRLEWLVRSAITDVRCGITDNGSSWMVAQDCFDAGDLQRAYRLSDYSLTNATFFNAPTRFIQTFTPGHLIASRYEHELQRYSIRLSVALVLLAIALIAMVITVIYSLRQNKQLKLLNEQLSAMNMQLKNANKVKEQYICRYLEVYSDYIRRLTTTARKAGEKDPAGFMDREMENFYRSFDDTFLSLYGSFVQDFNALLKPEARITPKPGERMTVEMRIFALILLGITSSAKIAELLCYSPNTISNYRVKMKNGCLGDRDTFEQRVQQIGTI
ncbi:MAG: hypothetical protein IKD12_05200 [Paludibacteraceae bacterium]|nr:hypothetical protein [Paludibacteraceae bacterium]